MLKPNNFHIFKILDEFIQMIRKMFKEEAFRIFPREVDFISILLPVGVYTLKINTRSEIMPTCWIKF